MRPHPFVAVLLAILLCSGCASSGMFPAATLTTVELADDNFRVVATGVGGEAYAAYILGVSASIGPELRTFALARIEGEGFLAREALQDLWRNFEAEHGPVVGRRLALVNVRFDTDVLNLLVYVRPRMSVRADVVEFID
jgi:hypothetical protein